MKQTVVLAVLLTASGAAPAQQAGAAAAAAAPIYPQPIPAQYNIPGNRAAIQKLADTNDVKGIRKHAWDVWSGLTADSRSKYQGKPLPIWETWLATSQVFTSPPKEVSPNGDLAPLPKPNRDFKSPHQFAHGASALRLAQMTNPGALVGFNKFDPSMTRYIWVGHEGPAGAGSKPPYFYSSFKSQWSLNLAWPADTRLADRKVVDAPASALELKPVLQLVFANKLTAIPFWQGPRASTVAACANVDVAKLVKPKGHVTPSNCHPDPSTWTSCVVVDAKNPAAALRAATPQELASADTSQVPGCKNAQYGGIDLLYHFALDTDEAKAYNAAQNTTAAAKGDSMVLVAMHVNTKEIEDWTWQTFYWQAGQATPDDYPGSTQDKPAKLPAPWNNYNMCAAYAQTTKPNNQGEMNVCFNPYLETSPGIPDGLRSNCVSCHGTAAINNPPTGGYPLSYYKPVDFNDPQYFECATQTDFSYAVQGNPTDAPPPNQAPAWDSGCAVRYDGAK